jgi:signal transduction histidine kinase
MLMRDTPSDIVIILMTIGIVFLVACLTYSIFFYRRKSFEYNSQIVHLKQTSERTLLQAQLEIQEQTLAHIAREMHANLSSIGTLVQIHLSLIKPEKVDETREKIKEVISLNGQLLNELKELAVSLNTEHIQQIGFYKALRNELERLKKMDGLRVQFLVMGDPIFLTPEKEIILFRLCQEIINNVLKHSNANTMKVQVNNTKNELRLEIEDDGIGFDPSPEVILMRSKKSTGLLNIKTRAKMINAHVEIISEPHKGTKVKIIVPADKT